MPEQPPEPFASTLASVANELAEQARKLKELASTAVDKSQAARSRTRRARDTSVDDRLVEQSDLQLLREQIEDLAAQAWALQWRYDVPGVAAGSINTGPDSGVDSSADAPDKPAEEVSTLNPSTPTRHQSGNR